MTMEAGEPRHGRLWMWLDQRVGLKDLEKLARKKEIPVHRHSLWYYLGGMTLFFFAVQVASGILLMLYYRPSAEAAFESVEFVMTTVPFGCSASPVPPRWVACCSSAAPIVCSRP